MKHALAFYFSAGGVDRKAGVILGVSLATVGPARGHGVNCDLTTLEQLRDCAAKYSGGLKVKMTHDGDAGDIIGALRNLRVAGDQLRGDLYLLEAYDKREYVMELAEKMPDTFGLSVVFSGPVEEIGGLRVARCTEIYSCDLVSEPAANPTGLFSAVDAGKSAITSMSPDEIKTQITLALTAALSELTTKLAALETAITAFAPATELAALRSEMAALKTELSTAKTELAAKIGDDASRTQATAKVVAMEFAKVIGTHSAPADGAGAGTNPPAPSKVDAFDVTLTANFELSKSKVRAWQLSAAADPVGYSAFVASGRKPAFEAKK